MSSISTQRPKIHERVDTISQLADKAESLREEARLAEERQNLINRKNKAFDDLQQTISRVAERYKILREWMALAEEMGADIDRTGIDATVSDLSDDIHRFSTSSFEDYENEDEIEELNEMLNDRRRSIQGYIRETKSSIESECVREQDRVTTTETVLRIPDVGTDEDNRKVDRFKQILGEIQESEVVEPERYREAKQDYETVDIDINSVTSRYGLSDEAGEVLLRFLDNETVTLSQVDGEVLTELQTLDEFSERLQIKFHNQ